MVNPRPIQEQTLSANGNTDWAKIVGPCWVSGSSSFGGGTAKIQRKNAAGTAVDIVGESHTVAFDRVMDFPSKAVNQVRVTIAGSSAPTLAVSVQWTSPWAALEV